MDRITDRPTAYTAADKLRASRSIAPAKRPFFTPALVIKSLVLMTIAAAAWQVLA